MKNNKLLTTLNDLGLSENEARVYLASLSLGPTTVLKIAAAAEIKRTTAYSVIQSLTQKGLMRVELRGFKELFVAEDPTRLKLIFDARREKLKELLPEFSALYNLKRGESTIKYYEGLNGIKGVFENLLEELTRKDYYLVISDRRQLMELDKGYFEDYFSRRAKIGIETRSLLQDSEEARHYQQFGRNYLQNIKILPRDTQLTTNLVITPKRVVIMQMTAPIMAIVIETPSIIQMHKELFEIIWENLLETNYEKI